MRRREGEERRARSINSSPILSQDALEELQTAIKEAESLSHSNSSQNSENLHKHHTNITQTSHKHHTNITQIYKPHELS
jgi:hypothetical protein